MKKKSYLRKFIFGLMALPVNLLAEVGSYIILVGIRMVQRGKKKHLRLEALEKGNYIKRKK